MNPVASKPSWFNWFWGELDVHRWEALFRREFPPTEYRNHGADQHRDRTIDGPGRCVAHRATTKHADSLERPDQTEHCDDHPGREGNEESHSHIAMLRDQSTKPPIKELKGEGPG